MACPLYPANRATASYLLTATSEVVGLASDDTQKLDGGCPIMYMGGRPAGAARRGLRITIIGSTNNDAWDYTVCGIIPLRPAQTAAGNNINPSQFIVRPVAYGNAIISAAGAAVVNGAGLPAGWGVADEITLTRTVVGGTPRGDGEVMEGAYGSPGMRVYSPKNDEAAYIVIPDMGDYSAFTIDIKRTVGAGSANVLVEKLGC